MDFEFLQKSVAFSSYHFLLRCPVLLRIDLNLVAERFRSLELDVLALGKFDELFKACFY